MRLASTATMIPRVATVDTEILGHFVPAGSNIVLNTRFNHARVPVSESIRSPTSRAAQEKRARGGVEGESGRDLDVFEPERWLVQDASGKETFDPYSLPNIIFGGGLRGCFGKLPTPDPTTPWP